MQLPFQWLSEQNNKREKKTSTINKLNNQFDFGRKTIQQIHLFENGWDEALRAHATLQQQQQQKTMLEGK